MSPHPAWALAGMFKWEGSGDQACLVLATGRVLNPVTYFWRGNFDASLPGNTTLTPGQQMCWGSCFKFSQGMATGHRSMAQYDSAGETTSSWVILFLHKQISVSEGWAINHKLVGLKPSLSWVTPSEKQFENTHKIQERNRDINLILNYHFRVRRLMRKAVPMITKTKVLPIRTGRTGWDVSARWERMRKLLLKFNQDSMGRSCSPFMAVQGDQSGPLLYFYKMLLYYLEL